ncbi:MAG: FIMAH domain-containing protein, partial [Nitrososphaera sp.]
DTDDVHELFSVPLAGGTPTKLNGALVSGGDVFGFQISPDSSRVAYVADQDTDEVSELFSVLLAGTPEEATEDLISDVESLVNAGTLTEGQGDGLKAKLNSALASLAKGNIRAACNQLQAFINQVNDLISNGPLTPAEGQELIDAANAIRSELGC